jgi:CheY-like chemotaxis protein
MPEIDGFELIARLRKSTDKSIRRIPIATLARRVETDSDTH